MAYLTIPIVGPSAVRFWMDFSRRLNKNSYFYEECERVPLPENFNSGHASSYAGLIAHSLGLELPLHLMASENVNRNNTGHVRYSCMPKNLPENSFIRIKNSQLPVNLKDIEMAIYVASPEYCFLSSACKLSFAGLVEFGNDLCSNYAYDSLADLEQIFRKPITTSQMIRDYVESACRNQGFRTASRAVRYVLDGSNSEAESKIAAACVLPFSEGGYNLPFPEFNKTIRFDPKTSRSTGLESCCCDLVWEKERVVIEYDSNLTHLEIVQHFRDKKKETALVGAGYKPIILTAETISNFNSIENAFELIRKSLGVRFRKKLMDDNRKTRIKVQTELFDLYARI